MPELPEVRTVARTLRPITCAEILRIETARDDVLRGSDGRRFDVAWGECGPLVGQKITRVWAHGKQLWLHVGDATGGGPRLMIHLGMSGRLRIVDAAEAREGSAARLPHTHVVFHLRVPRRTAADAPIGLADCPTESRDIELHFVDPRRFGMIRLLMPGERVAAGRGQKPGPDAYRIGRDEFLARLMPARRQLKALLLDQHTVAGLGNIYADETLHAAGLHPLQGSATLRKPEWHRLFDAMKAVLKRAIRAGGSTLRDYRDAAGLSGRFQHDFAVYGRAGEPCTTCGSTIRKAAIAGRTTCYCPRCQRLRKRKPR